MTTAVLYHDGCPDGWTAAWVAHRALQAEGKEPQLIPVVHNTPPPDLTGIDEVYILDFSYKHDTLVEMTDEGGREVTVLDHHRSALTAVCEAHEVKVPDDGYYAAFNQQYEALFDTNRSGAGIAWDYWHHEEPRPPLVDYVEDRDLWNWALPQSKAVNAYIMSQPYELEVWDQLGQSTQVDGIQTRQIDGMAELGAGVLAHINAYCRAAANHAYLCEMGGRTFPIVNITYESCSDVMHYLLEHMNVDMAGYFFERGDGSGWQYGFRSRNGVTVHDFAKQFGGGGHPQASGCTVPELVHKRGEP